MSAESEVREAIAGLEAEGRSFVKSAEVAREIDLSPQQIGQHLEALEGELVERWSTSSPFTWRIL